MSDSIRVQETHYSLFITHHLKELDRTKISQWAILFQIIQQLF